MEKAYADALVLALEKGTDEKKLVEGLFRSLAEHGRMKLLPRILRELRARDARLEKLAATLEIAEEGGKAEAVAAAKAAGISPLHIRVNPSLVSGWRAREGGTLIDRSGKQALVQLYRNIITN